MLKNHLFTCMSYFLLPSLSVGRFQVKQNNYLCLVKEEPWKVIMKTATLIIIPIILLGACGQLKNVSPEQMSQVGQEQLDCSLQL